MNGTRPIIEIKNVYKFFGQLQALNDVSLSINSGEKVVIIGPSGSGKSTLLRSINRLETIDSGSIVVDGQDINAKDNDINLIRQELGMVFQSFNLFPHKTVLGNLTMAPMKLKKVPELEAKKRALALLDKVGIREKAEVYPAMLSGGQQQRVGLARALAADPKVMLMDEPFGAIDAINRQSLQDEMLHLQRKLRKTILFVTHDVDEALKLADKIVILREGRLVQYGQPCDLLTQPADDFVRSLLNADDRIRQLSMLRVGAVMEPLPKQGVPQGAPTLSPADEMRIALSVLLQPGVSGAVVLQQGQPVGWLSLQSVQRTGCNSGELE